MITSPIVMVELPNVGHMPISTILFGSSDKALWVASWIEIKMFYPSFQNAFALRMTWVGNFGNIIKMATAFIKATLKDLKKVKGIRNIY